MAADLPRARRRIRIRTGAEPWETTVTDPDGRPVDRVVAVAFRQGSADPFPLATLTLYEPDADVTAELVDLERLAAAEAVCREAQHLVRAVRASLEAPGPGPLPPETRRLIANTYRVEETLTAWCREAGLPASEPPPA